MSAIFARAGKLVINLLDMIYAEDDCPAPQSMRIKVLPGEILDLHGRTAQELRVRLLDVAPPNSGEVARGDVDQAV